MIEHPIRRADVQAAIERWTEVLLRETGSGTVEITIELNCKDRKFLGLRLGGAASRIPLDSVEAASVRSG